MEQGVCECYRITNYICDTRVAFRNILHINNIVGSISHTCITLSVFIIDRHFTYRLYTVFVSDMRHIHIKHILRKGILSVKSTKNIKIRNLREVELLKVVQA